MRASNAVSSATAPAVDLTNSKRLYRELALRYHPNRAPGCGTFMRDLNTLWQAIAADLGVRL